MKSPETAIKIQNKKIGRNYPTYFIADIAANHDGDIERAKELIYLAAAAGADAAKFSARAKTISRVLFISAIFYLLFGLLTNVGEHNLC